MYVRLPPLSEGRTASPGVARRRGGTDVIPKPRPEPLGSGRDGGRTVEDVNR